MLQFRIAFGLRFRVRSLCLITAKISYRLVQCGLERPLVERKEQLPFGDVLTFFEMDADDLPVHLRTDLNHLERLHVAYRGELQGNVSLLDLACDHWRRRRTSCLRGVLLSTA